MFSFFRRRKGDGQVPEWASFFTGKEYSLFMGTLEEYLRSKGASYTMGYGEIIIKDNQFGSERLGLLNLGQICKQTSISKWAELIRNHFDGMHQAWVFQTAFETQCHDIGFAEQYIGVRLYHKDYIGALEPGVTIGKLITPDIYAMLVFDLPYSVMNIKPEQTIQWNKTNEELFDMGVENIRKKYPFEITSQDMGEIRIFLVHGDHFFTPNIIFDLEKNPDFIGKQGTLIGIPHRHIVLISPINDLSVVQAISSLCPIIHGMNAAGPGSISNSLYWYFGKDFRILHYTFEKEKLQFFPPESFVEVLNDLDPSPFQ